MFSCKDRKCKHYYGGEYDSCSAPRVCYKDVEELEEENSILIKVLRDLDYEYCKRCKNVYHYEYVDWTEDEELICKFCLLEVEKIKEET
jgi:hypothetical protein